MNNHHERNLHTQRLMLRPLTLDDADALFRAFSDAETMRFMDQPVHSMVKQTRDHLARMISPESCWWAITLSNTDTPSNTDQTTTAPIGFVGYLGNTAVPGMGYLLHRAHWRQGIMTEAVNAALDYGFTTLGLDRVELWINDGNLASQRLAETTGFTRRSQFRMKYSHDAAAHDKVVYGLYRYEWAAKPERAVVQPRVTYGVQPILAVADVQTAVDFYCNQLDFRVNFLLDDPPTYGAVAWQDWSGEGGVIQLREQADLDGARKNVGLFFFVGPQIDALCETYRARGVRIVRDVATQPWGMREFTVEDCNGYLLRFGTAV